jgi:hypothetical protein
LSGKAKLIVFAEAGLRGRRKAEGRAEGRRRKAEGGRQKAGQKAGAEGRGNGFRLEVSSFRVSGLRFQVSGFQVVSGLKFCQALISQSIGLQLEKLELQA